MRKVHRPLLIAVCILTLLPFGVGLSRPVSSTADSLSPSSAQISPLTPTFLTDPAEGDPLDITLEYLTSHAEDYGLKPLDVTDFVVTGRVVSAHNGVTHLYLRQRVNGIEIKGAELNVNVLENGQIASLHSAFMPDVVNLVDQAQFDDVRSRLDPRDAAHALIDALALETAEPLVYESGNGRSGQAVLSDGGVAREPIPVSQVYQPTADGYLHLGWQVQLAAAATDNLWLATIDAASGAILHLEDLVIHEPVSPTAQHDHAEARSAADRLPAEAQTTEVQPTLQESTANGPYSYTVFPLPVESPNHAALLPPADGRSVVTQPADPIASPFGWHDDDGQVGADSTTTRGNNVDAYEDSSGQNAPGYQPDGGVDLIFNPPLNLTSAPAANRDAAIVNLFYTVNTAHDIFYHYGFDEVSGNFQANNYGRGGVGNDRLHAEAQDGSGMNNANFWPSIDGGQSRIQMFLWDKAAPHLDGDLDNGIIIHEFGHGISSRLTGGPGNISCLTNQEHAGEGWSDWFALMLTMEAGDVGSDIRGLGTYALNQPLDGTGIRLAPYTTDMSLNGYTYADLANSEITVPHGVGFVYGTALWELTWELVEAYGFDPDLYTGQGGNNLALQLVVDSLKLQPCKPGFVDSRDALLEADLINNGGANQCAIWRAFAKRGLGVSAQQGSSSSRFDGVAAFDVPEVCQRLAILPASQAVCQGNPAAYTVYLGEENQVPTALSIADHTAGMTVTLSAQTVLTTPTTLSATVGTDLLANGRYTATLATSNTLTTTADFELFVAAGPPPPVDLLTPIHMAQNVSHLPELSWDAPAGIISYTVEIATSPTFEQLEYSATTTESTHRVTSPLEPATIYYWRVRPINGCGQALPTSGHLFVTSVAPHILLVDDDDNQPDVSAAYTAALDALGVTYDIWDTEGSDLEPTTTELERYETVIWFSGDAYGGATGPSAASEVMLGSWLDAGGCLLVSAQDYYWDRGLTPFMQNYLGVDSVQGDVAHTTVVGTGTPFSEAPYQLAFPFTNWSDALIPDSTAQVALESSRGNAALSKQAASYRSIFMSFPLSTVADPADRVRLLGDTLDWCSPRDSMQLDVMLGEADAGCSAHGILDLPADGGEVTYCYTLQNTGSQVLEVDALLGMHGRSFNLSTFTQLQPGETVAFTETQTITSTQVTVAGWSARQDGMQATVEQAVAVVVEDPQPLFDVQSAAAAQAAPGQRARHVVTLVNTGNVSDTYTFTVSEDSWPVSLSIRELAVKRASHGQVVVTVEIPPQASIGASDSLMLTATSILDPTVEITVELTTTAGPYLQYLPLLTHSD